MAERKRSTKMQVKDAQTAVLKIPPHSIEAEQSVLGGLMLDNQAWERVSEILHAEDFYLPQHRMIFSVLQHLANRNHPFDVLTVAEALKTNQQLDEVGGEVILFELAKNTPSAANIDAYADIVRERSVLRQLIGAGTSIIEQSYAPGERSAGELLDDAERTVFQIAEQQKSHSSTGPIRIDNLLNKAVARVDTLYHSDEPLTGLATGYKDLDEMTSGLQPADLIIIAGRPSMGKTVLGMNIAEHTAIKTGLPVLVFSMEMPGEALAMRMMSSLGRIDQHRIRSGKLQDHDWPRITSAVTMLSETKLFIDDSGGLSPADLRTRARRLTREHGQLGLIVVDYLQLMRIPGYFDNRVGEISEISRSLKALAKELNVPLVALSQLNRGLEQRTDKRPVMSDLRESGAIEQDADVIMFIYRDEVYHPESRDKGIAEIIIAKQRNGPIGRVKLTFLGQYTRFENYLPESFMQSQEQYA
jgi:replicative DNA helicase